MEEPLEILVVEPDSRNRQAARDGCPDGVVLIFAGSYEEAMIEVEKNNSYDKGIFELRIPRDGKINGWGYLPMLAAMNRRMPSLLFTEKPAWGEARAYIDPLFYIASPDRCQLKTAKKSEKDSWSQVFDYLINNKEVTEML